MSFVTSGPRDYGGCGKMATFFDFRNCFSISDVRAGHYHAIY